MSYCLLPMVMSFQCVQTWLMQRPYNLDTTCILIRVLDKGLTIFRAPAPPPVPKEILAKLDELESHVNALKAKLDEKLETEALLHDEESAYDDHVLSIVKSSNSVELTPDFAVEPEHKEETDIYVDTGEVTITVRHKVKWECSDDFERWTLRMEKASSNFDESFCGTDLFNRTYFLGLSDLVNQTTLPKFDSEYVVMFRFSNRSSMEQWLSSKVRTRLLAEVQPMLAGESKYKQVTKQESLETEGAYTGSLVTAGDLFGELLMGDHDMDTPIQNTPPPIYRTTILTLLGLFLVVWPLNYRLTPALVQGGLTEPSLLILTLTCISVFGNAYVTSPLVFFFFATWLQRPPPHPQGCLMGILTVGLPNNLIRGIVAFMWFAAHLLAANIK